MDIFIGCSSSDDIPKEYFEDCKKLLEEIIKENNLIFGACNSGLMGLAYNEALKSNKKIVGICPEAYKDDFKSLKCDVEVVTKSVGKRTNSLIELSDVLIFLPGGIGTIYELFTAIESKRCHEFNKPIIIYNSNGYYDKLLEFLDKMYNEKFSNLKDKNNYLVTERVDLILDYINNYKKSKKMNTIEKIEKKYKDEDTLNKTNPKKNLIIN